MNSVTRVTANRKYGPIDFTQQRYSEAGAGMVNKYMDVRAKEAT